MMKTISQTLIVCLVMSGFVSPSLAKPLLTSSEETYASACIAYDHGAKKMVQICLKALEEASGAGEKQMIEMLDSLGSAYTRLGNDDAALKQYRKILAIDADEPDGLSGLAWVYHGQENWDKAIEYFGRASDGSPSSSTLAGLGSALYRSKKISLEKAIGYMDASLAIKPKYRWALREKGWLYRIERRYEESLAPFQAAIEIYNNDDNAHYGLARSLRTLGRYDEALTHVNRSLEIDPDDFWATDLRARILHSLKRYNATIQDADRTIALRPKRTTGYVRKARAMEALGERGAAIALLKETDQRLGQNGFLIYWLADMLATDGAFGEAEAQIMRNTSADDVDADDYELLAYIRIEARKYEAAQKAVYEALQLNPGAEFALYYDAQIMLHADQPEAALKRFDEAISAGLSKSRVGYFASLLVGKGLLEEAIELRAKHGG